MNTKKYIGQSFVLVMFLLATAASIYLGSHLINDAHHMKKYKKDLFMANQIKDGFLSGKNWSRQVERIIEHKIDSFAFSKKNKKVLNAQVSGVMNSLLDQVDVMIHEKQDNFKDKVKMGVARKLIDIEELRAEVPKFAGIVVAEIDKSSNRAEVKDLVKEKLHDLLIGDSTQILKTDQQLILARYKQKDLKSFNRMIEKKTAKIEAEETIRGYQLIGIMAFILLLWVVLIKQNMHYAYALAFMFSVIISFINLYVGINLPMLEIDARIAQLDLEVLQSHIIFFDQILFYQAKSIWDVAYLLLTNGKVDSIFVGALILLFSVAFPAFKLIAAMIYLFKKKKKETGFIHTMAFKSGKWSMADVMVVAIFIAFVGFQGILTDQLNNISSAANEQEMVNLMTTNRSNLQVGFMVFVAFVLFNLFLAVVLKKVTKTDAPTSGARMFKDTYKAIRDRKLNRQAE